MPELQGDQVAQTILTPLTEYIAQKKIELEQAQQQAQVFTNRANDIIEELSSLLPS